jgi:hypothetical protein
MIQDSSFSMSLRGRKFFDVLQHHPSSLLNASRLRLPCPPYHSPDYWERIYKDLVAEDVIEWGGFDLQDGLLQFRYELLLHHANGVDKLLERREGTSHRNEGASRASTTFAECMGVSQLSTPEEAIARFAEHETNHRNESILILGCGNSKVGEQLLMNSFVGPVLQIDVSSKIIQLMAHRYDKYLSGASIKRMELVVDDAKQLTALSHGSVGGGVLDKGLIDVMHCSMGMLPSTYDAVVGMKESDTIADNNPIEQIVDSVHRVLQPSRPFIFFSRSEPEYILRRTLGGDAQNLNWNSSIRNKWKDIKVLKLIDLDVLMYRFLKAEHTPDDTKKKKKRRACHVLLPRTGKGT